MSVYNRCREEHVNKPAAPKVIKTKKRQCNTAENPFLSMDRDTILTAALLLLLIKDGGDKRLIIALGYILIGGEK